MRNHIKFFTVLVFTAFITSCVNEDKGLVPGDVAASAKTGVEVKSSGTIDVDLGGDPTNPTMYISI